MQANKVPYQRPLFAASDMKAERVAAVQPKTHNVATVPSATWSGQRDGPVSDRVGWRLGCDCQALILRGAS